MPLENYKATLWSDSIIENYHNSSFIGEISTAPVEIKGERIIFNRLVPAAWKNYLSGQKITWDEVATTKLEMTFPNQKYYAFLISEVDEVQIVGDVINAVTKEQSAALAEQIDQEVVKYIIDNVTAERSIGTKDAPELTNKTTCYDMLVDMNTLANKAKVPTQGRYMIIPPDFLALLNKSEKFTTQYTILENGIIEGATVNGATLICKADNPVDKIVLTIAGATGFAMQIEPDGEAVKLVDFFGTGIRGLVKYGYTKLRDEASCVAFIKYA
jgi:hypothetical protein